MLAYLYKSINYCIIYKVYQGSQNRLSRKEKMMADAHVVYFAYAGSDVLG